MVEKSEDVQKTKPNLRAIYKPEGAAREYAELGLNLINGCDFGCLYCYNPDIMRRTREDFRDNPVAIKKSKMDNLARDCKNLKGTKAPPIHLCFIGDPYQKLDLELQLTRQAIKLLKEHGLTVQLLTKAGLDRVSRDFDLLEPGIDKIGATLTLIDPSASREWEPEAALPKERIAMLKEAKERGFHTWVSMEPVLDPSQTLTLIERTHEFVDLFWIGKLNVRSNALEKVKEREASIDWPKFAQDAKERLESFGCQYHLKKDLLESSGKGS